MNTLTMHKPAPELSHERMTCMEVWGGNRSTWSDFVVPGLDIWVYSQPFENDDVGGDVYYLSSCASGRITRLLLGDVSGHGSEASETSAELHRIMQRNVNFIDQSRMVDSLNQQFERAASDGRFATALIGTYFAPTRKMTLCSAGHPPPLIFSSVTREWTPHTSGEQGGQRQPNVPFGVIGEQKFRSTSQKLHPGDMVLACTDSLYEAVDENGSMLGATGLAKVAESVALTSPEDFVPAILTKIREINPNNLTLDDTTLVLLRANEERVSLKDNLLAPFRLLSGLIHHSD